MYKYKVLRYLYFLPTALLAVATSLPNAPAYAQTRQTAPVPSVPVQAAPLQPRNAAPVPLRKENPKEEQYTHTPSARSYTENGEQGNGLQVKIEPNDKAPSPSPAAQTPPAVQTPSAAQTKSAVQTPSAPAYTPTDRATTEYPLEITQQVSYPKNTTFYELSNGLTVLVHHRPKSQAATVRVFVRNTGSAFEGEYLGSGISHLLEHLVAEGLTATQTREEIKARLNRLGGASNAWTSKERTCYLIDCTSKAIPEAIDLMADMVNNTVFEPKTFASEKKVVRQEMLDGLNSRPSVAHDLFMTTFYRDHTFRYPIVGYPDQFDSIAIDDVRRFYSTRYVPNNETVVIAGDIAPEDAIAGVVKAWRSVPRGRETAIALPTEQEQIAPREVCREMDGPTCDLILAWSGVALADADTCALDVLALILAEGETSRLVERLQRKTQLAVEVNAGNDTPDIVRGGFTVMATVLPKNLEKARSEILDEVYRMREIPVTGVELARAKKRVEAEIVFHWESVRDVAAGLGDNYLATGNPDFYSQYIEGIRAVGIEDIRRVAKKYFLPETLTSVLITPRGTCPKQVGAKTETADASVQAIRFPSTKLRLLTKTSNLIPMVNIQMFMLGGVLADTDTNAGRGALLAEMLDKGSARFNRDETAAYFDGIGASLRVSCGRNTIFTESTVLKADLSQTLAVMLDAVFNPLLTEEEFARAKKTVLGRIEHRMADPTLELIDFFGRSLPRATPYHLPINGTKESIEAITLDEIKEFHAKYFHPSNMVVSVSGDFDATKTAAQIDGVMAAKQFGPPPVIRFDRPNELLEPIREHKKTTGINGLGMVGWPIVGIGQGKELAALTVLQTILGGYGYPGGRLFNEMRGEGLVYRLNVGQLLGPAPGYFFILFETTPNQMNGIFERIDRQIASIGEGNVTQEDVKKAKELIIAFHAVENDGMSSQARQNALDELYGLGFDYDLSFDQRIEAVTLEDVIGVARRYFHQKVVVTTSPEDK